MPYSRASVPSVQVRRVAALPAVLGATALLLAGCAVAPPVPAPEAPTVAAVVSETQERKILDAVATTVAEHDEPSSAKGLAERVTGPALAMREAELRLAAETGNERWRTDLSTDTQQVVLPSDKGWPRTSYAVQPDGPIAPALMVFDQASAREQYQLWGYVSLVPGVSLPPFADPGLGSAAVAPDDDASLVSAPQDALAGYAEVLTDGEAAKGTAAYDDDRLRQELRQLEKSQTEVPGWKTTEGKYSFAAKVDESTGLRAVRTADGGALVVGGLTSTQTIELGQEGAEIKADALPPAQQALLGDRAVTGRLRTSYQDLVALYVPSAGSEHKITLVGFRHLPVDVSSE